MKNDYQGFPFDPKNYTEEQRKFKNLSLRRRVQKAGWDVNLIDEIIADVIKTIGPDLRRCFSVDLPAKINAAIAELKSQKSRGGNRFDAYNAATAKMEKGCGGSGGHFTWDYEGKTRKICKFDKG